jgi:hypothetical protein
MRHRVDKSHFCKQHTAGMLENKDFYLVHMTNIESLKYILQEGYLRPGRNGHIFFTLITPDNRIDLELDHKNFISNMKDRVYMIFPTSILNEYEYTWGGHWTSGVEHYRMDRAYSLRQNLNLIYNYLKFDDCYMEQSNMPCNEFMINQYISLTSLVGIYYPMKLLDEYVCIAEKHREYARFIAFQMGYYLNVKQDIIELSDRYPQHRFVYNTKNSFLKRYVKVPLGRYVIPMPFRMFNWEFWSDKDEIEREADYQEREIDKGREVIYKGSDCVK